MTLLRPALVALLGAMLAASLVPVTAFSAAAGTTPTVTVSPEAHLQRGQVVRVSATGLQPRTTYQVIECDRLDGTDGLGCPTATTATSSRAGELTLRLRLEDYLVSREEFGDGRPVYCRADQCRVFLATADDEGDLVGVGSDPLEFRGSPATIGVTPSSDLAARQTVTVTGTAFGAERHEVRVLEQACIDLVQGSGCFGGARTIRTTVRSDGTFSVTYLARRFLPDGTDCTDVGGFGGQGCSMSVVVLDKDGQPDRSFGDSAHFGDPAALLEFRTG